MASVVNVPGGTDLGASSGARNVCLKVVLDTSYPTGGETLSFAPYTAFYGVAQVHADTVSDRSWSWSNLTQKLVAIVTSTGAELAAAQNPSADVITLVGFLV